PRAFTHFGFTEPHSDYLIWRQGGGPPSRCDIAAHRLGRIIVDRVLDGEGDLETDWALSPAAADTLANNLA
ncbi:MAG: hypothetical protein JO008_14385, partial [Alphaproteobacteria bacterium]|nr:hypothetical protein [Alphaproteobacteria bacterium]